jgi:pimeloyl-ACP methyl ester carboxylesterase
MQQQSRVDQASNSRHKSRSRWFKRDRAPTLYLSEYGDGDDLCLLVHGLGDARYVWGDFMGRLCSSNRTRAAALDLRGHGDSEWDRDGSYDMDAYVGDLVHVIEAMDARQLVLVGHSMGAEIAIRASAYCAERVSGMVIVDFGPALNPTSVRHVHEQLRNADQAYQSAAEYAQRLAHARPLARLHLITEFAEGALRPDASGRLRLKSDPALAFTGYGDPESTVQAELDLWHLLRAMRFPTLLVRGAGSAVLSRAVAEQMNRELPNLTFATVPSAGHAVMLDNPDGFAEIVSPFIENLLPEAVLAIDVFGD